MNLFKFALNCSTIRPAGLIEKILIAAETGYEAIELWSNELAEFEQNGGALRDIKTIIDDYGLSVATVIALKGWVTNNDEERKKTVENAKKQMEQAAFVGANHIIASPPKTKTDLKICGQKYRELLELGRQFGVKPAIEFLGFAETVNQIQHACEIMRVAQHSDSCIVLDSFHIFRGAGEIEDIRKIPAEKIAVFHFNDAPALPERQHQIDADRVYPGDGIINLAKMVSILKENNYNGVISLELFNPKLWNQNPKKVAKIGLEKMKEVCRSFY